MQEGRRWLWIFGDEERSYTKGKLKISDRKTFQERTENEVKSVGMTWKDRSSESAWTKEEKSDMDFKMRKGQIGVLTLGALTSE